MAGEGVIILRSLWVRVCEPGNESSQQKRQAWDETKTRKFRGGMNYDGGFTDDHCFIILCARFILLLSIYFGKMSIVFTGFLFKGKSEKQKNCKILCFMYNSQILLQIIPRMINCIKFNQEHDEVLRMSIIAPHTCSSGKRSSCGKSQAHLAFFFF